MMYTGIEIFLQRRRLSVNVITTRPLWMTDAINISVRDYSVVKRHTEEALHRHILESRFFLPPYYTRSDHEKLGGYIAFVYTMCGIGARAR